MSDASAKMPEVHWSEIRVDRFCMRNATLDVLLRLVHQSTNISVQRLVVGGRGEAEARDELKAEMDLLIRRFRRSHPSK